MIFSGEMDPECSPERAAEAIALMLQLDIDRAKSLLNHAVSLRENVSAEQASDLVRALHDIGLHCQSVPMGVTQDRFEIMPLESRASQRTVTVCPACQQPVPQNAEQPVETCPGCGIAFAKYAQLPPWEATRVMKSVAQQSPVLPDVDDSETMVPTEERLSAIPTFSTALQRAFDTADAARLRLLLLAFGAALFFLGVLAGAAGGYLLLDECLKSDVTPAVAVDSQRTASERR